MINYSKVNSILNDEKYWEAVYDSFGTWLGFWYGNKNFTFEETKEVFFLTLKKLLDDDKVVFFPPDKLWDRKLDTWTTNIRIHTQYYTNGTSEDIELWDVPSKEVINYIKKHFPKDVTDENDLKLNDFWYGGECPAIGWIDQENGFIHAS